LEFCAGSSEGLNPAGASQDQPRELLRRPDQLRRQQRRQPPAQAVSQQPSISTHPTAARSAGGGRREATLKSVAVFVVGVEGEGEENRQLARDRRGQSLGCNDNNNMHCALLGEPCAGLQCSHSSGCPCCWLSVVCPRVQAELPECSQLGTCSHYHEVGYVHDRAG
jgi:hypothetical protein